MTLIRSQPMREAHPITILWPWIPRENTEELNLKYIVMRSLRFDSIHAKLGKDPVLIKSLRIGGKEQLIIPTDGIPLTVFESIYSFSNLPTDSSVYELPIRLKSQIGIQLEIDKAKPGMTVQLTVKGPFEWIAMSGDFLT